MTIGLATGVVVVALLEGFVAEVGAMKLNKKTTENDGKTSLQSVSYSETDVTVNLTTFEELLPTMNDGQKHDKSGWVDPGCNTNNRGQNKGL